MIRVYNDGYLVSYEIQGGMSTRYSNTYVYTWLIMELMCATLFLDNKVHT